MYWRSIRRLKLHPFGSLVTTWRAPSTFSKGKESGHLRSCTHHSNHVSSAPVQTLGTTMCTGRYGSVALLSHFWLAAPAPEEKEHQANAVMEGGRAAAQEMWELEAEVFPTSPDLCGVLRLGRSGFSRGSGYRPDLYRRLAPPFEKWLDRAAARRRRRCGRQLVRSRRDGGRRQALTRRKGHCRRPPGCGWW